MPEEPPRLLLDVPPSPELEPLWELSDAPPWLGLDPELPSDPDELELDPEPRLAPELPLEPEEPDEPPDEPEPDCACVLSAKPVTHNATINCFFIPD